MPDPTCEQGQRFPACGVTFFTRRPSRVDSGHDRIHGALPVECRHGCRCLPRVKSDGIEYGRLRVKIWNIH